MEEKQKEYMEKLCLKIIKVLNNASIKDALLALRLCMEIIVECGKEYSKGGENNDKK